MGLLGSTRVGSRRVIQISAGFMIFFSILGEQQFIIHTTTSWITSSLCPLKLIFLFVLAGKFGALFASIPFTIFAAVYCVLFGLVGEYWYHYFALIPLFLTLQFGGWICTVAFSFCGAIIFAIYKHELNEEPLHHGCGFLPGFVHSWVFQGIHLCCPSWSCSYKGWMGESFLVSLLSANVKLYCWVVGWIFISFLFPCSSMIFSIPSSSRPQRLH